MKLSRASVVLSAEVVAAVVKVLMTEPVRIYHVLRLSQLVVNPFCCVKGAGMPI